MAKKLEYVVNEELGSVGDKTLRVVGGKTRKAERRSAARV